MLLDFTFSFEKDVPQDDICRTLIEIAEEVNLNMYVDFSHRNSHGYDGVMMFKLVILAKAEYGYVSTRDIAHLCKTDVRYMFIAQNQRLAICLFKVVLCQYFGLIKYKIFN
ncbi:hypothetical protein [Thomasclavelia sp.]|uniref:hypothetical protein n=1 Tax=Thomasclavelia sp. TaxID=3025757 RepID=UPI0039A0C4C2